MFVWSAYMFWGSSTFS